jgi:ribonuclease-3
MDELNKVLEQFNISINNKDIWTEALTSNGYVNEHKNNNQNKIKNYRRMEFLGDRLWNLVIAEYLFSHEEELPDSGSLASKLDTYVNQYLQREIFINNGLKKFIYRGKGEVKNDVLESKQYANFMESFIAAVYLDNNCQLNIVRRVVMKLMQPYL